jgi:predicted CoA-substrate-specific enzyme activase
MKPVVGIDLGSRTTKIVQLECGEIGYSRVFDTGHNPLGIVEKSLREIEHTKIIATGYGRHLIRERFEAECVTEIKACAVGVHALFPSCGTILDVGRQDCKVVHLDGNGRVANFEMNDRCAAGTGKFLEVMAQTFDLNIEEFVGLALTASESLSINSMCTVFAESEVVSLITSGQANDKIALGLHRSIANRLSIMLSSRRAAGDIVFIGGGAKNNCLHAILEKQQKTKLQRPPNPQIVTAMGAAMLGASSES